MTANGKKASSKKAALQNLTHQMTPGQLMKGLCGAKGTGVTLAPEIKGTKNACPACLKVLERMEEKTKAKGAGKPPRAPDDFRGNTEANMRKLEAGSISDLGNKGAAKVREMDPSLAQKGAIQPAPLPLLGEQPVPAEKLEAAEKPASAPTKGPKAPKAPRAPKAAKKATTGATGGDEAPAARDPRLPPVGTLLTKKDRDGKEVTCKVLEAGVEYKGETFKTLSGAARAAAKDLGLATSQNGFLFWGVIHQARAIGDPSLALIKAYDRFDKVVDAVTASKPEGAVKAQLAESLRQFAAELSDAANAL